MNTKDFYYDLPQELIAQTPAPVRDESRLLVYHRASGEMEHRIFRDVIDYLNPGDALVINETRVLPARLIGEREDTGGAMEFLLLRRVNYDTWETLVKPGKRAKTGVTFSFGGGKLRATVLSSTEDGVVHPGSGWTQIFIMPGYRYKAVDALITNFHLPESTLLMLVSAFMGRENALHMYETAVQMRYRFFSFGDATLLL